MDLYGRKIIQRTCATADESGAWQVLRGSIAGCGVFDDEAVDGQLADA